MISEKLSLDLVPETTARGEIEAIVKRLGFGIAPRDQKAQGGSKPLTTPAAQTAHVHGPDCAGHDHGDHDNSDHDHSGHDHAGHSHSHSDQGHKAHNHKGHDHKGHDHSSQSPAAAASAPSAAKGDVGHGSLGHVHDDPADRGKSWYQTGKGKLVIFTGVLLALAWAFELLTSAEWGYWAFTLACVIGVAPVAKRAFEALRLGQPFTIESLMTIAAIGALFIGAAEVAALVVFLFAVGEVLEGVAAGKAREGIRALANLVPKTALLEEGGKTREVPAESLEIGQRVNRRAKLTPYRRPKLPPLVPSRSGPEPTELITEWRRVRS